MADLLIPADLVSRLKNNQRQPWSREPLTADEREAVAIKLEWLAAEVREKPVQSISWSMDRDTDDTVIPGYGVDRVVGPWRHTVEVAFK